MNSKVPDLAWLENPEVFEVNREKAHSDHRFYESVQAMERGEAEEGKMAPGNFLMRNVQASGKVIFIKKILTCQTWRKSKFQGISKLKDMISASISIPCIPGTDIVNLDRLILIGNITQSQAI